jgi:hypothetical protein
MDKPTEQELLLDHRILSWLEDWPILRMRRIANTYFPGRQNGKPWSFRQAAIELMEEEREHARAVETAVGQ